MKKQTAESILKSINNNQRAMNKLEALASQLQTKVKEDKKRVARRIRYEDEPDSALLRQGFCEICGSPAEQVHHIIEVHQQIKWNCRVSFANLVPLCKVHHQMVHNQDSLYLKKGKYRATVWPEGCLQAIKLWLMQEIAKQKDKKRALSLKAKLDLLRGAASFSSTPRELNFPLLIKRLDKIYMIRNPEAEATEVTTGKKVKMHCFISGGKLFAFKEGEKYFDVVHDPHLVVDEWITQKPN